TPADLRREILGHSSYEVELAGDVHNLAPLLAQIEPSLKIATTGEPDGAGFRRVTLTSERDDELGEPLLRALATQNFRLRSFNRAQPTLEDVFLAATRRSWDVRSEDLRRK
ncbi:MAG TPA: DUF4162 domain-containing protein, partial [Opitutus sp.]|nr:DUF4162 domain-containing protein [Opitutus sp.]